jgi:cardiolipin synthase
VLRGPNTSRLLLGALLLALGGRAALAAPPEGDRAFWRRLERLAGNRPAVATRFEPLRDGHGAFQSRLALVRGARSSIVGTLYAVDLDRYGFQFLDELTAAARRGVRVVVAIDRIAQLSYDLRADRVRRRVFRQKVRALEQAGGVLAWYGRLALHLRRLGVGLHYKTLVADGRAAILDGRNIGHEYVERWTDFGARVEGPVVGQLARAALRFIGRCKPYRGLRPLRGRRARRERFASLLRELRREARHVPRAKGSGPRLTLLAWDPLGDERAVGARGNRITEALSAAVDRAEREVILSSNFVHAGKRLRRSLIAAARRGVRVRIVTTGEAASEISIWPYLITSAHYRGLLRAGCEIYETTRMEHGKMYVVDRRVGAFGSYNASKIADRRNTEGLLFTADRKVIDTLVATLEDTIHNRSVRHRPPPPSLKGWLRRLVQVPLRLVTQ